MHTDVPGDALIVSVGITLFTVSEVTVLQPVAGSV
jgi:hypothetical protein